MGAVAGDLPPGADEDRGRNIAFFGLGAGGHGDGAGPGLGGCGVQVSRIDGEEIGLLVTFGAAANAFGVGVGGAATG